MSRLPIPLQRFVTPVEDGHPFHFPSTIPTQDIKTNNNNLTNNKTNPASNPTVDLNKKRADSELQKHGSNQEHLNFTNQTSQQQQTPNDSITRSLQLSTNSDNLNSNPSTLASLVEGLNWQDSKAPLNRQDSAHQKINKILSDHKAGSFEHHAPWISQVRPTPSPKVSDLERSLGVFTVVRNSTPSENVTLNPG